jgi:arylsulfatase
LSRPSDNGAELFSWPDGGMTPFRNEKNSNWEGGYRVPALVRWPGVIKPGTQINDITSLEDMVPTLMAAAGEPDIKEKLLNGYSAAGQKFKVHLDGYNMVPFWKGEVAQSPRREFFYWNDDGSLVGLRYDRWKIVFMEQRSHGFDVWQDPMVTLRMPKLIDLRADPFERADHESIGYSQWRIEHAYAILPAVAYVSQHLATYVDFPPRQKAGTFGLDQVLEKLQQNKD